VCVSRTSSNCPTVTSTRRAALSRALLAAASSAAFFASPPGRATAPSHPGASAASRTCERDAACPISTG